MIRLRPDKEGSTCEQESVGAGRLLHFGLRQVLGLDMQ
jgi:hypothetical protein